MTRAKTSKEVETDAQQRRTEKQLQIARFGLETLESFERELAKFDRQAKMAPLIEKIREHREWLVVESEAYRTAASDMYLTRAGQLMPLYNSGTCEVSRPHD